MFFICIFSPNWNQPFFVPLRIQALAMKARTVAGKMNDAGIAHQEAATCQWSRCPSWFDFESPVNMGGYDFKSQRDLHPCLWILRSVQHWDWIPLNWKLYLSATPFSEMGKDQRHDLQAEINFRVPSENGYLWERAWGSLCCCQVTYICPPRTSMHQIWSQCRQEKS